jgi:hypothetical protein
LYSARHSRLIQEEPFNAIDIKERGVQGDYIHVSPLSIYIFKVQDSRCKIQGAKPL